MDVLAHAGRIDMAPMAAGALCRVRQRAAAHISPSGQSDSRSVRLVAVGLGDIRRTIPKIAERSSELLSVGVGTSAASLLSNHRANLALRERGLRMISLFDYESAQAGARQLLATLTGSPYHFCHGNLPMKILDRRTVLLDGPTLGGDCSLIAVTDPQVLSAALRYWTAVWPTAVDAATTVHADETHGLTARQREVAGLMAADLTDEAIAQLLGVCVRTVRTEIALMMRTLNVRTRFSVGVQLARSGVITAVSAPQPR